MSDDLSDNCFCVLHQIEELSNFSQCLSCAEKLCEVCIANEESCSCGEINEKGKYKIIYITKGDIKFEICKNHNAYQCHFLCLDCMCYICVLCTRDNSHGKHKNIVIDEYINIQKNNIDNQKENINNVLQSIKGKYFELNTKKELAEKFFSNIKQKTNSNQAKFSELLSEIKQKKRKEVDGNYISDILDLKKELLNRKKLLEIRKKYTENFKNFISGNLNFIIDTQNSKLLPFFNPENFLSENIEFANKVVENIDHEKKYKYSKITMKQKGNEEEFKLKEVKLKDKIKIDEYNLPNDLKEFRRPFN